MSTESQRRQAGTVLILGVISNLAGLVTVNLTGPGWVVYALLGLGVMLMLAGILILGGVAPREPERTDTEGSER